MTSTEDSDVLGWWADFPIHASPRPLVLTGPDVVGPAAGFANGYDKSAFIHGHFELRTALPGGPETVDGHRIRPAADALAELCGSGDGQADGPALAITAVLLETATFATDRGARELPAWSFRFAGGTGPASVLAVPPADRWPQPGMPTDAERTVRGVTVSDDGSEATVAFVGAAAGTGLGHAEYAADVAHSRTAVSISVRRLANPTPLPSGPPQPGTVRMLGGHLRTVTVTLQPPLGDRVLVDSRGVPLPESDHALR